MNPIVTLEPWSPWPLVFPAIVVIAAVVTSIIGTRRRRKLVRELGYLAFVVAVLTGGAMAWTMIGIWDSQQRTIALESLGYETPTYGGSMDLSGGAVRPISFQAERDGERVRGVFRPLGGDQWEISEIEDDDE